MRADARRNRARILDAAEALLVDDGPGLSTAEVARRAGVGAGTVFRHFPTKADLLAAVSQAKLARLTARAEALADADPGASLQLFLVEVVRDAVAKRGVLPSLAIAEEERQAIARAAREHLVQALDVLLERAHLAGAVRADVRASELLPLVAALTQVPDEPPGSRERTLELLWTGLSPRGPGGA